MGYPVLISTAASITLGTPAQSASQLLQDAALPAALFLPLFSSMPSKGTLLENCPHLVFNLNLRYQRKRKRS